MTGAALQPSLTLRRKQANDAEMLEGVISLSGGSVRTVHTYTNTKLDRQMENLKLTTARMRLAQKTSYHQTSLKHDMQHLSI
jgi:hypothetical protein